MKKIFLLLFTTLFLTSLNAQFGQARLLEVKEGQMSKFMDGVAKKTQKYNNSEGSPQFYTFQISVIGHIIGFILYLLPKN